MNNDKTIVTATNKNFIWGAYLLIASLRYHNVSVRVHILAQGLTEKDKELLTQFENVKVFETSDPRNLTLLKPDAILTADSEHITWIDADCIVVGDITKYLTAPGESLQIRLRSKEQVTLLYKVYFGIADKDSAIPNGVLEVWKKDVNERDVPAIETTCLAHCFTLHRKHINFIRKWQRQISKVVPSAVDISDTKSFAYHMTDESVLNSLLVFAYDAPLLTDLLLDKDQNAYILHYNRYPKPWKMWRLQHLKYFDLFISIIEWVQNKGYKTPPIPWSLKRKNKLICYSLAYIYKFAEKIRNRLRRKIYKP